MAQQTIAPPVVRDKWFPMTFEEFLSWSPDEGQSEWVDGKGIAYLSNSARHDRIVIFLTVLVGGFVEATRIGEAFTLTMLMRLLSRPSGRMPDLFVVLNDNRERVLHRWHEGPADFVVEIVSDSSSRRDLEEKRLEYQIAGVHEYLIIDGREDRSIFIWYRRHSDGVFREILPDNAGRYHSSVLPGFWLESDWFAGEDLPGPLAVLSRMVPEAVRQLLNEESS